MRAVLPVRAVLSVPPSPGEKILLPLIGEPIAGVPREQPQWSGAYTEVSGIAKIASKLNKDDPVKKDQFTFSKVVKKMGTTSKKEEEPAVK